MTPVSENVGAVAIASPAGENSALYSAAVEHGSGTAIPLKDESTVPDEAGALLVIGTSRFDGIVPASVLSALENEMPVLGVSWGMHVLNVALGGDPPVAVPGQVELPVKRPVFISPGAKLSYTIAGSGWVSVPFSNSEGIRAAELAPGVMASCYREDGFIAAFEVPGRNWVIGVQWDGARVDSLPTGFDSLLLALVERAAGIQ